MVNKYILDSNIIIALINQDSLVRAFSRNLKQDVFYVSMITRLEVMMGHSKHSINLEQIEMILDNYPSLPLDEDVCRKATVLQEKSKKKLKFKDLIIAATAIVHNKTLITSDKDFLSFKNLKVKYIKP